MASAATTKVPAKQTKQLGYALAGGITLLVAVVFLLLFVHFPPEQSRTVATNVATAMTASVPTTMPTCPTFSKEHHTCAFGNTPVYASTGTVAPDAAPAALCFDRLGSKGDYTLLNANGSEDDGHESGSAAIKGFEAPEGQVRAVTYWLADKADDCKTT